MVKNWRWVILYQLLMHETHFLMLWLLVLRALVLSLVWCAHWRRLDSNNAKTIWLSNRCPLALTIFPYLLLFTRSNMSSQYRSLEETYPLKRSVYLDASTLWLAGFILYYRYWWRITSYLHCMNLLMISICLLFRLRRTNKERKRETNITQNERYHINRAFLCINSSTYPSYLFFSFHIHLFHFHYV